MNGEIKTNTTRYLNDYREEVLKDVDNDAMKSLEYVLSFALNITINSADLTNFIEDNTSDFDEDCKDRLNEFTKKYSESMGTSMSDCLKTHDKAMNKTISQIYQYLNPREIAVTNLMQTISKTIIGNNIFIEEGFEKVYKNVTDDLIPKFNDFVIDRKTELDDFMVQFHEASHNITSNFEGCLNNLKMEYIINSDRIKYDSDICNEFGHDALKSLKEYINH